MKNEINKVLEVISKSNFELISELNINNESKEYNAATFKIDNLNIIYRKSKITPKKSGQFVTLWKRVNNITTPFDMSDKFDYIIIYISEANSNGYFIFNKQILYKNKVISGENSSGKRAIRLYPDWENDLNKTAIKTQSWQLNNFFKTDNNKFNKYIQSKINT